MAAKLPEKRVSAKDRDTIADMEKGHTAYSWCRAMVVDEDRSCYLRPDSVTFPKDLGSDLTALRITRGDDGWYVVHPA